MYPADRISICVVDNLPVARDTVGARVASEDVFNGVDPTSRHAASHGNYRGGVGGGLGRKFRDINRISTAPRRPSAVDHAKASGCPAGQLPDGKMCSESG